jgi:hypothetical protein
MPKNPPLPSLPPTKRSAATPGDPHTGERDLPDIESPCSRGSLCRTDVPDCWYDEIQQGALPGMLATDPDLTKSFPAADMVPGMRRDWQAP